MRQDYRAPVTPRPHHPCGAGQNVAILPRSYLHLSILRGYYAALLGRPVGDDEATAFALATAAGLTTVLDSALRQ